MTSGNTSNQSTTSSSPIDERELIAGGIRMEYLVAGHGPPVVLLHGDGDSARAWQWVMPDLARQFTVYAPSFPGFGRSEKPPSDYSARSLAASVIAFLDALTIDRAAFVGSSIGGLAAIRIALVQPHRVSALVLIDSAGLGREINPVIIAANAPGIAETSLVTDRTPPGIAGRLLRDAFLLFHDRSRVPREWLEEQTRQSLQPGYLEATIAVRRAQVGLQGQLDIVLDDLSSITMPTMVVWGYDDAIVPVEQAREAVTRLPNSRLRLIPGCGHLPHVEQPAALLDAMLPFLGRLCAADTSNDGTETTVLSSK